MRTRTRPAFTITELLVVVGVIVILLGLLFPALAGFRQTGLLTRSMSHLRQIAAWMKIYSGENRDFIVPSQFDYSANAYPGKVRSKIQKNPIPVGREHAGTWADVLWTVNGLGPVVEAGASATIEHDYAYDSPDGVFTAWAARTLSGFVNPLRSMAGNTRNFRSPHDLATPYGPGAGEVGYQGFFAANGFFNADPAAICFADPDATLPAAGWTTNAQIRSPERSVYLVDSFCGEVIQPWEHHWSINPDPDDLARIDFRYNDMCLMLFLDGHVESVARWNTMVDLEGPGGLGFRITDPTRR